MSRLLTGPCEGLADELDDQVQGAVDERPHLQRADVVLAAFGDQLGAVADVLRLPPCQSALLGLLVGRPAPQRDSRASSDMNTMAPVIGARAGIGVGGGWYGAGSGAPASRPSRGSSSTAPG